MWIIFEMERKKEKKGGVENEAHQFLIAMTLKKTQWPRSLFWKEEVLSACVPGEVCKNEHFSFWSVEGELYQEGKGCSI